MEKEGLLERQQQGRQWYVVSPEAASDKTGGGDETAPGEDDNAF